MKKDVFGTILWAQPFWISCAHLSRMTEVVTKVDSGEKTSCFVDVCNGNLTLWTYLGIKLIEIDTYDAINRFLRKLLAGKKSVFRKRV